jgi:hypothetical protein
MDCALTTNGLEDFYFIDNLEKQTNFLDFEMFKEVLWLIKDEDDQYTRRALITKYIRVC